MIETADIKAIQKNAPQGCPWVCVFGTSDVTDLGSATEAEKLGAALAKAGFVVLTGGYGAAMEGANRGASGAGGYTAGVICSIFSRKPNSFLDQKIKTGSLIERLDTLLLLADGYIACRGGTGTLAEIAMAWEYINKSIVPPRRLVLLGDYWAGLPGMIQAADETSLKKTAAKVISTAKGVQEAVGIVVKHLSNSVRD